MAPDQHDAIVSHQIWGSDCHVKPAEQTPIMAGYYLV